MAHPLEQYGIVGAFRCLGAECPDTCCHGWDMLTDSRQKAICASTAPELLEAIDPVQGILKRDAASGDCAQLCEGKCTIHAKYGTDLLSDACYFYPRLVHRIGDGYVMGAAISCPEILRLVLTERSPFVLKGTSVERMPMRRHDLVPEGWEAADVRRVMAEALGIAQDETLSPEAIMLHLLALAERREDASAPDVPAEAKQSDAHALYYALALTESFGEPGVSRRLCGIMQAIGQALDCSFDRDSRELTLGPNAGTAYAVLDARWKTDAQGAMAPVLRRWIAAQLMMTAFPFGGFMDITIRGRAAVMVQRFATIRLALMCHVAADGTPPDEDRVIHIIQGISRFMDHLADAKLTMMIHRDSGWLSPARLRGLIFLQ